MHFMTSLPAFGGKRGGKSALLKQPAVPHDPMPAKRAALTKRLKAKADAADQGSSISLAGKTDDEIIVALRTR